MDIPYGFDHIINSRHQILIPSPPYSYFSEHALADSYRDTVYVAVVVRGVIDLRNDLLRELSKCAHPAYIDDIEAVLILWPKKLECVLRYNGGDDKPSVLDFFMAMFQNCRIHIDHLIDEPKLHFASKAFARRANNA